MTDVTEPTAKSFPVVPMGESEQKAYVPNKEGVYIAKVVDIDISESTIYKDKNGDPVKQFVFQFALIRNAVTGKPVMDAENTVYDPAFRKVKAWRTFPHCFVDRKTKEKRLTSSGELIKALGVDPFVPELDTSKLLNEVCLVHITHTEVGKEKIEAVMPYEGDKTEFWETTTEPVAAIPAQDQA